MPILLEDKNREYKRYRHTPKEKAKLYAEGFQHVLSSNVSAIKTVDNDLIIRFHGGATYSYSGKADLYDKMLQSNSKGKFVWAKLIRPKVPYRKVGSVSLPSDPEFTDRDLMETATTISEVWKTQVDIVTYDDLKRLGITITSKQQNIKDLNLTVSKDTMSEIFVDVQDERLSKTLQQKVKDVEVVEFVPAKNKLDAMDKTMEYAKTTTFDNVETSDLNELNKTLHKLNSKNPLLEKYKRVEVRKFKGSALAKASGEGLYIKPSTLKTNQYIKSYNSFEKTKVSKQSALIRLQKDVQTIMDDPLTSDRMKAGLTRHYQKQINKLEKELQFERWSVGAHKGVTKEESIETIITHEYGHTLQAQNIGDSTYKQILEMPQSDKRVALANEHKRLNEDLINNLKQANKSGDIYKISQYAQTNEKEFFAETYTMYIKGENLPSYIVKTIEEILGFGGKLK